MKQKEGYLAGCKIESICINLSDLTATHLKTSTSICTTHLFANVLDRADFASAHLAKAVKQSLTGENIFFAVSPCYDNPPNGYDKFAENCKYLGAKDEDVERYKGNGSRSTVACVWQQNR